MWSSGRLEEDTCYMLRDFKFYKTANNNIGLHDLGLFKLKQR